MSTLTTEQKGQIALAKVLIEAARKGAVVYLPTTPGRCDVVLEIQGRFFRGQVKYADSKSPTAVGAVRVDLRKRKRRYTKEEIDLLLVYVPQIDEVCCFGAEYFDNRIALQLRLEATKNGQKRGCLIARDHVW